MISNTYNWFGLVEDEAKMIHAQRQQIMVRIIISSLGAMYLAAHAERFMPNIEMIVAVLSLYLIFNLLCLPWLKWKPFHGLRLILSPIFDVSLTAFSMWLDGGITSPYFIVFLIIIAGNGVRFGNMMLLYTQGLTLLALAGVGLITVYVVEQPIDWLHMAMQLFGVTLVPGYGYVLGQKLEKERHTTQRAERETVGLLDASPIPAFTFAATRNGRPKIRYANSAISLLFGENSKDMHGKGVDHLAIQEDMSNIRSGCQKILQQADPKVVHRFDIRSRSKDGKLHSLMCQASAIHWRDQLIGMCLMTDVTENEHLHQKLETAHRHDYINSLVAGLTHDFRNVLTNIIGNAEILQMETENAALSNRLKLIIQAGERGSDMITHLLNMVRRKKTPRALIHLQDTLHATIRLAHLKLPENVGLECSIADDLPPFMGHAAQIDQVVLNLIENAAQAIQKTGMIRINVKTDAQHPLATNDAPAICISVQDNGCGIEEEDLQHVFDSFWTSREDDGGTGLGLTMVKRIVGWHNGELKLDSTLGKGTSIYIALPPAPAKNAPEKEPEKKKTNKKRKKTGDIKPANTPLKAWRVLLVDDDPDVRHVHQIFLERLGLSVTTAGDGKSALQMILKHTSDFDMVVTDYHMPEMDGLEMAQQIQAALPGLPIVMVTAFCEDERLQDFSADGFSVLAKPINPKLLSAHILDIQREASA